jgi:type I restriction enzyme S subunit
LKAYKQSVITEAVTKGLNPNVPMKESGIEWIGQIPVHWEVCRLKDCLKNISNNLRVGPFGSTLSGNDICDFGEYWIYNQRCVLDNNFITNNSFITKDKYKELESFRVYPNDILITTRGSIGKIAIVPENAPIGIIHPCIIRFVINELMYNTQLLKYIFNESDFVLNQLRYQSNSTTIDVIYSYALRNITLPKIPISEQQSIADYLDTKCTEIDNLISIKQQKIKHLKEYKKSIIYEYVTGKKEVED